MRHVTAAAACLVVLALALVACAHRDEVVAKPGPAPRPPAKHDPLQGNRHVLLGVPTDADDSDDLLIDREHWVASYNPKRLVPNWVAWQLVAADMGEVEMSREYYPDMALPREIRVDATDYANSGYERAQMCSAKDRSASEAANRSTFLMSNMLPQLAALAGGPWKRVEELERSLVEGGKQLAIVAGGVFSASYTTLGPGVGVPAATFKIIVVMNRGQTVADVTESTPVYAVLMPNSDRVRGTKWSQYLVSVSRIEEETGYTFLTKVPGPVKKAIAARVAKAP